MTLGERIKIERTKKGVPKAALGELLQLTQQAVGRWEKNLSEPDSRALTKMAHYFGVTVDELLGRNDFTPEERAAGLSHTRKEDITPLEEDLLFVFRDIGKRYGENAQRDYITVGENMLKLSNK